MNWERSSNPKTKFAQNTFVFVTNRFKNQIISKWKTIHRTKKKGFNFIYVEPIPVHVALWFLQRWFPCMLLHLTWSHIHTDFHLISVVFSPVFVTQMKRSEKRFMVMQHYCHVFLWWEILTTLVLAMLTFSVSMLAKWKLLFKVHKIPQPRLCWLQMLMSIYCIYHVICFQRWKKES